MILSNIATQQNSPRHLEQLAAVCGTYGRAKALFTLQFFLTVPAALLSAAFMLFFSGLTVWVVFYSLTVGILDTVFLDRLQKSWKKQAAQIQEKFDCEVLGIPWNHAVAGAGVDSEDVIAAAAAYSRYRNPERLKDWYPPVVDGLPLPLARLICQRANCWWDSSLRKRAAHVLTALLVSEIVIVFGVALGSHNTSVEGLIIAVYAPLAPSVLWTLKERYRQLDAATTLDSLRAHVESVWQESVDGDEANAETMLLKSRQIQNLVFAQRASNPLIYDWVNDLIHPNQQQSMREKAQELVSTARNLRGGVCRPDAIIVALAT